jgi:hypothetical protein
LGQTFSYHEDIPFTTYLKNIQAASKFASHLSPIQIALAYSEVSNKACTRQEDENHFYLEPVCLFQKKYPTMEFTQVVDMLYDNIQWFNHVYNTAPAESFNYEWASPIYKDNLSRDFLLLQNTQAHKAIAAFHSIEQDKIQIPKNIMAEIIAQDYTFYAVYNDTSMRRWCTLTNYKVALQSMDKVFLYPGHVLNFNQHIRWLPYCTGRWRTDLMFYGGVCGAASQLFRSALIIPWIQVTQRHGHSERWGYYYGDEITGDDAAIYEMHKQLEIKNNDTRWIYFRTIIGDNYDYLIAVSPYKSKQWVQITRERETALRTNLTKNIYDIHNIHNTQEPIHFPTRYIRKNNTRN